MSIELYSIFLALVSALHHIVRLVFVLARTEVRSWYSQREPTVTSNPTQILSLASPVL